MGSAWHRGLTDNSDLELTELMQVAPATVPTSSEIEAIVRAVLQRLQAHQPAPLTSGTGPVTANPTTANPVTANPVTATSHSTVVRLDQPLITLEDLRDRWDTLRGLEVPLRCVVTPAVHDELRRHGISLSRFESQASSLGSASLAQPTSKLLLLIPAHGKSEVRSQLKTAEAQVAAVAHCEKSALEALKNHLQDPQAFSIWSSPRPFASLRSCADLNGAAAVQLSRPEELPAAIEQAQPNLLILDDRRWTASGVAHVAQAWLRSDRHSPAPQRSSRR